MIRPHTFPCTIPRADADALHRASGRVYSETLVWHYRVYRLQRRKVFLLARNNRTGTPH